MRGGEYCYYGMKKTNNFFSPGAGYPADAASPPQSLSTWPSCTLQACSTPSTPSDSPPPRSDMTITTNSIGKSGKYDLCSRRTSPLHSPWPRPATTCWCSCCSPSVAPPAVRGPARRLARQVPQPARCRATPPWQGVAGRPAAPGPGRHQHLPARSLLRAEQAVCRAASATLLSRSELVPP
jgi:hypothetical protein